MQSHKRELGHLGQRDLAELGTGCRCKSFHVAVLPKDCTSFPLVSNAETCVTQSESTDHCAAPDAHECSTLDANYGNSRTQPPTDAPTDLGMSSEAAIGAHDSLLQGVPGGEDHAGPDGMEVKAAITLELM